MFFHIWVLSSKNVGCLEKTTNSCECFFNFLNVEQHPMCLDHGIQTQKLLVISFIQ